MNLSELLVFLTAIFYGWCTSRMLWSSHRIMGLVGGFLVGLTLGIAILFANYYLYHFLESWMKKRIPHLPNCSKCGENYYTHDKHYNSRGIDTVASYRCSSCGTVYLCLNDVLLLERREDGTKYPYMKKKGILQRWEPAIPRKESFLTYKKRWADADKR